MTGRRSIKESSVRHTHRHVDLLAAICLVFFVGWESGAKTRFTGAKTEIEHRAAARLDPTLIAEHCPWGLPRSNANVRARRGYITEYDPTRRIPLWSAYHVKPEYRSTPQRKNRFSRFRKDPDVTSGVVATDYNGLMRSRGFARGHLAPFFVMGGDRNNAAGRANLDRDRSDPFDEQTVFESNYMSNVAPQHHGAFNGPGGAWYKVETYIRKQLVDAEGLDVWVVAGCVLGPGKMEQVGPDSDIEVPPAFFQIVAVEDPQFEHPMVAAFLLPHHRTKHGDIQDFMVSVDVIEALTGLDFFSGLEDEQEETIEDQDTYELWASYFLDPD